MIQKCWSHIRKYVCVFCALIIGFVLLMTLAFSMPESWLAEHRQASITRTENEIKSERENGYFLFDTSAAKLDNYTDQIMLTDTINSEGIQNPLKAAMSMNGYARYWHGYQVFLRPALALCTYEEIRYFYMLIFFVLLTAALFVIQKKVGTPLAFALVVMLCMQYIVIIPVSMQFSHVFFIMLACILILCMRYNPQKQYDVALFFLIVGMVVNFVDFLTAPLLTLGVPLLYYLFLEQKYRPAISLKQQMKTIFSASASWTLGYGGCWFSKWLIASVVLKRNVVSEAITAILFRTGGSEDYPLDRGQMLMKNVGDLLSSSQERSLNTATAVFWIAVMVVALILAVCFFKGLESLKSAIPFIALAAYPYIWYLVLGNHSDIHHWFTFRVQGITVIAFFMISYTITDWNRCAMMLKRIAAMRTKRSVKKNG